MTIGEFLLNLEQQAVLIGIAGVGFGAPRAQQILVALVVELVTLASTGLEQPGSVVEAAGQRGIEAGEYFPPAFEAPLQEARGMRLLLRLKFTPGSARRDRSSKLRIWRRSSVWASVRVVVGSGCVAAGAVISTAGSSAGASARAREGHSNSSASQGRRA